MVISFITDGFIHNSLSWLYVFWWELYVCMWWIQQVGIYIYMNRLRIYIYVYTHTHTHAHARYTARVQTQLMILAEQRSCSRHKTGSSAHARAGLPCPSSVAGLLTDWPTERVLHSRTTGTMKEMAGIEITLCLVERWIVRDSRNTTAGIYGG